MKNTGLQVLYLQCNLVSSVYIYDRIPAFIGGALWCIFPKKSVEFVHKNNFKMIRIKVTNATFIWSILLLNATLIILS